MSQPGIGKFSHQVIVQFHERTRIPYVDGAEEQVQRLHIGPWDQLARKFAGITLRKLDPWLRQRFENSAHDAPQRTQKRLLSSFVINCPPEINAAALVRDLYKWPNITNAYVAPWNPSLPSTSPPRPFPPITEILRPGSSGTDVVNLQTMLNMLGAGLEITGYYGDEVKAAVIRFHRLMRIMYVGSSTNELTDCSQCGTRPGEVCPHRFNLIQQFLPDTNDTSFLTDLLVQMYTPFAGGI